MTHFTIDSDNNITVHPSKKAAKATGTPVFSTEEQFADAIGNDNKRLLAIWNSLPGVEPVKRFANRKTATERIWTALQTLGQRTDAPSVPDFASCTKAVEALPETPFDGEPKPGPVASEHQAGIESAAVHVADQPTATPVATAELVGTEGAPAPDVAPAATKAGKKATRAAKPTKPAKEAKPAKAEGVREGSKTAQVVALLKRENGATLSEIMEKFGWQRHTVRGFMAGAMKKAGYTVESFKPEGGERTYRINS